MKNLKIFILVLTVLVTGAIISAFTTNKIENENSTSEKTENKTINMFVSHGHCITPFAGTVDNFKLDLSQREDLGNPLENMRLYFEIDPNTFNVCANDDLTERIKTPGLFIGEKNEKITFKTTNTYTIGIDWYSINGLLSIKGVEKEVTFYASGIRSHKATWPTHLSLEGQIDLFDWDIDYDKIVSGQSDPIPNKWMHFNMKIDMLPYNTMGPKSQTIEN